MRRLIILMATVSAPAYAAGLSYPSLEACRADQESTFASSQEAYRNSIGANAGGDVRDSSEWATWRKWHDRFEEILSICRTMEAAQRVKANAGKPEVSAKKSVDDLNDLHELLSDRFLTGAVPNTTVRGIQEKSLSTVRSKMSDLAALLDGSTNKLANVTFDSPGRTTSKSSLQASRSGGTGNSVLGADAASALVADVSVWKIQEAARQERLRLAEQARLAEEARVAQQARLAESQLAQARAAAAAQRRSESKSTLGAFFGGLIQGAAAVYVGSRMPAMTSLGVPNVSGNSERCQQALDQIKSQRETLASMSSLTSADAAEVRQLGNEAIASNQSWYNQNCG